jgi:hypothetical protein
MKTPSTLTTTATKGTVTTSKIRTYLERPCTQSHPITCTTTWGGGILAQGVTTVIVGFQPGWPSDLAKRKQGSTTTKAAIDQGSTMQGSLTTKAGTATKAGMATKAASEQGSTTTMADVLFNLQWPLDGSASTQGSTNTKAGSGINIRWTTVTPDYIFKHGLGNSLQVHATSLPNGVPTTNQWSGSPKLFGLKQVSGTLAKPFLCLQAQAITKSSTCIRWEKADQSVMTAATEPHCQLHLLVIQSAVTSRSPSITTSFLSKGASSNLAKNIVPSCSQSSSTDSSHPYCLTMDTSALVSSSFGSLVSARTTTTKGLYTPPDNDNKNDPPTLPMSKHLNKSTKDVQGILKCEVGHGEILQEYLDNLHISVFTCNGGRKVFYLDNNDNDTFTAPSLSSSLLSWVKSTPVHGFCVRGCMEAVNVTSDGHLVYAQTGQHTMPVRVSPLLPSNYANIGWFITCCKLESVPHGLSNGSMQPP